jgi:hypothetical protein
VTCDGLAGVLGLEGHTHFALADKLAQIVRNDLAEIIDAGLGMLERT